jgi:ABC-type Zn2+ transport system substrate-binding protein/surface adhesin
LQDTAALLNSSVARLNRASADVAVAVKPYTGIAAAVATHITKLRAARTPCGSTTQTS